MTAPVQPPAPGQPAPAVVPVDPAAAPIPSDTVWPPDEATMLALQMDARFSIIDEPAGERTPGADRQEPPAGATAPAVTPPASPAPPVQG